MLFDGAAAELAVSTAQLPAEWAAVDINIYWSSVTGTGNVVWRLDTADIVIGQAPPTPSVSSFITVSAGAGTVVVKSAARTGVALAGVPLVVSVARLGNDAGDTLVADAGLIGVELVPVG
jgi:hypothetical protein